VNFDFSDDQKQLRETVRRYLTEACPRAVVRRVLEGPETHAAEVWRGLADLGVIGAAIPERFGGAGLGPLEVCVVAEELGRACAPVPYATTVYLFAQALLQFGSEAQQARWLPGVAAGKVIGTLAVAEGPRPVFEGAVATTFGAGRLSGRKWPVADGLTADAAIVVAGAQMLLVDLTSPGVSRSAVETIDPSRKHAEFRFDGAAAELLGTAGAGWRQLTDLQTAAAVPLAFEQIGGTEAAMYMARDYALERYAFGRPIGSQQAIKHKLADAYIKLELARSNAFYGAMTRIAGGADVEIAAAAARIAATDAYVFAAQENVQVHGGIGFTWAADPQLHYRRARLLAHMLGGPALWKDRLVRALERRNAA
jgi:alkylation response protein AidB-like acyl-CoA dehydrogenase